MDNIPSIIIDSRGDIAVSVVWPRKKNDVQCVTQDVDEIQNALQELAGQIEDKVRALSS
jgi:hypothetical protein